MKIIESFKEYINNSMKEIQENTGEQVTELNKLIQDLKVEVETIEKIQTGKHGSGKPRKEVRNYRCKYLQQNTRDRRESLRCRRYHRKDGHKSQRKWKMQKASHAKHTGNSGDNEKTKPKCYWYRREQGFPT